MKILTYMLAVLLFLSALSVLSEEDRKQLQCGDIEEALHEQNQQTSDFNVSIDSLHVWQGICFFELVSKHITC